MQANRSTTNSLIGRNSPLDRVRSRARSSVGQPATPGVGRASNRTGTKHGSQLTEHPGASSAFTNRGTALAEILAKEIDFIDSDEFRLPGAEASIYGLDEVEHPTCPGTAR